MPKSNGERSKKLICIGGPAHGKEVEVSYDGPIVFVMLAQADEALGIEHETYTIRRLDRLGENVSVLVHEEFILYDEHGNSFVDPRLTPIAIAETRRQAIIEVARKIEPWLGACVKDGTFRAEWEQSIALDLAVELHQALDDA